MPLLKGRSRGVVSANIRELRNAGHPEVRAIAIAVKTAGWQPRKIKLADEDEGDHDDTDDTED